MLEEYEETRSRVRQRMKETRTALEAASDREERQRLRERLRILKGMYNEQCEAIERLRPPREKRRRGPTGTVRADAPAWDFFERSGACWSDLEGATWTQLQALASQGTGREAGALQALVGRAMATLPDGQRRRMDRYFNRGEALAAIAEAEGVNRSTVSRTLHRGLERVERYLFARLFLQDCITEEGRLDYLKFAQNTAVLTDRQLELLYLYLTTEGACAALAARLGLHRSTVCRTVGRGLERLAEVAGDLEPAACGQEAPGEEKAVAERLGLPPAFYYRFLRRGERIGDLPRYHYELLRLRDRGLTAAQAARTMGVSEGTVAKYWRLYRGTDLSALPIPQDEYRPAPRYREAAAFDLRRALARLCGNGDTVLDRIDGATYRRLRARAEGG